MIILNLIQNTALLMALVMTQQMLANSRTIRRLNRFPLIAPVLSGMVFGCVGIVGMMTPLHFAPGIIFDGRSIILSVVGLFGGPLVAAIAASLCGAYRLWLGGAGALVGTSIICEAAALGVVFYYLRQRYPGLMKNFPLLGFGILVHAVMLVLMLLLPGDSSSAVLRQISLPVLLVYPVATMLICRLFITQEENEKSKSVLNESEKNYRELVEKANSIILRWEPGGTITFFNEFAEKFFGFSKEEILGQSVLGTIVPEQDSANSDLRAMVFDIACNPKKYRQNENENMRKDGSRVWISWTNKAIFDAAGTIREILGIGNDITQRKQAEEQLRNMQQRLDFLISNLYAGFLSASDDGTVEYVNQAFCDLFNLCETPADLRGLSSDEMIKKILPAYASPAELAARIGEIVAEGKPVRGEEVAMRDGRLFMIDFIPLNVDGRSCGRIWHHQDITQRKQAEDELQKKNAELIHFNYTVSHDLKSPLVTIKTFLGYLEHDMAKGDAAHVEQDLGFIHTAADKMNALLEELLDLSRIGRVVNPPVEAPLKDIVHEALALVAGRIAGRGVQVVVTQAPIMLYGDRPRMVEVFQNLVDNAVKFMGDQSKPLIEIGAEIKSGMIVCFVRDNGIGIDPRHINKLFGMFEKLNANAEGTGLGLALVKRIIEVHGGKIRAESEGLGKGACFWFSLPGKQIQDSEFKIQD